MSKGTSASPIRFVLMSKNREPLSRLAPLLDSDARQQLQQALLINAACLCAAWLCRRSTAPPERWPLSLWSTPAPEASSPAASVLSLFGVPCQLQPTGHLGERMSAALLAKEGADLPERQLLLGIDSVELGLAHIDQCLTLLDKHGWGFVPTRDGGFIAAAWRPALASTSPRAAFAQEHWSHSRALAVTLAHLESGEHALTEAVADIDEPADLLRARDNGSLWRALSIAARATQAARQGTDAVSLARLTLAKDSAGAPPDASPRPGPLAQDEWAHLLGALF